MKENLMELITERIEKGEFRALKQELELLQVMGFADLTIDALMCVAVDFSIDARIANRDLGRLKEQMGILEDYYGEGVL